MKTPLTKKKLQDHIAYSSWKYGLLVILAIFGWNIIYSVTEYQPPEEKKITMGAYAYAEVDAVNAYMEEVRQTLLPDMEEMELTTIMPDEMYGDMILSTRFAARDYDIYILPRQQFQAYAAQGAFMPLEEALPELVADLQAADVSLSRGYRANDEDGVKHQYAIPTGDLPRLQEMLMVDCSDMYLCVFFETENNDNVLKFFDRFVRDMMLPVEEAPAEAAPTEVPAEPAPAQ